MNYCDSTATRLVRLQSIGNDPAKQAIEKAQCANDPVHWVNAWCWTYDPRSKPLVFLPFDLWPKQAAFLRWLQERESRREDGLVEKSRDVGATWLCCAYALHGWLFRPGYAVGFGSRKLDLVDKKGDPDCIFEKIRALLQQLPPWMRPTGFHPSKHDNAAKILNPANAATITGEGGDNIGRGGRKSLYFLDESAFLERPQLVDRSLSATTEVRIDVSTPNGPGSMFAQKRFSGKVEVFILDWRDDPRKDEAWYQRQKETKDPVTVAQEIDRDHSASIEGICIPALWVRAAVGFELPRGSQVVGGLDVGELGPDLSVLTCRAGPVALDPESWGRCNTTETAWRARDSAAKLGCAAVCYDAGGPGAGVRGVWDTADHLPFDPTAVQFGGSPTDAWWPDGQTSQEKFLNLRAEMWWKLRARFERTYEFREKGVAHAAADMISLPNHPQLIAELSLPLAERTEGGKIKLESKDRMRARGVKSPNFADALALAFHAEVSGMPRAGKDDAVKDPPADVWQTRPRRHDDPGEDGPGRVGGRAGQASAGGIEQLWPEQW